MLALPFGQWSLGSDLSAISLSLLPSTRGIIAIRHDSDIWAQSLSSKRLRPSKGCWDDLDKLVRFSTQGSCWTAHRWAFQQGYIQINVILIFGFYHASEKVVISSFLEHILVMVSWMHWDTPYMALINTIFGKNLVLLSFHHRTLIVLSVSISFSHGSHFLFYQVVCHM